VSIAEALSRTDGSTSAVVEFLEQWASTSAGTGKPMAMALAAGMAELVQYARGPMDRAPSAIEEEREAVEVSRRVVRPVLEARLQQRLDALDEQVVGRSMCGGCGGVAESQGRRRRGWASLLGALTLRRRYSYCGACEAGVSPSQMALGLPNGHFTPRFDEVATMMATTVPYEMATTLLSKICGVDLSKKALEGMTEERGRAVLEQLDADAKRFAPYDETGLPTPTQTLPPRDPEMEPVDEGDVAYIEMDGVIPITRQEVPLSELSAKDRNQLEEAKRTKARGGKARRYTIVGREVKNAVLYTAADCAQESPQRGCLLRKRYVSLLGTWTAFAALLWVELTRLRFERAKLVVILSDGAEWIRSLAAWLPFEPLLILDLYHVKHRVLEVAHLLWGQGTAQAQRWAHEQYARIEADQALMVIDALRFVTPPTQTATEKTNELKTYLRNNLDRMHYPAYRARGLRISSAAVESANFHVTGQRLKCQGMRWDEQGAREMAALRADLFNGRWEARTRQIAAG
jgi:hypothetical protein